MNAPMPLDEAPGRSPSSESRDGLLASVLSEIEARPRPGPAWLSARRASAAAWLRARGFPAPTEEAWRFTPIRSALNVRYRIADGARNGRCAEDLSLDRPALTLVNGRPVSLPDAGSGLEVLRLPDVLATKPDRVASFFGAGAPSDGFEATNDALFEDGVLLVARAGALARVHLAHEEGAGDGPVLTVPRVLVVAEPGSDLSIVETHRGTSVAVLECGVCQIAIGQGARVEHVRFSGSSKERRSIWSLRVHQDRDSRYVSRTFTFGGALTRENLEVTLDGEGAECVLEGLYTATAGDLVDHHTTIVHARPHGTSHERYKGVIDAGGTAVFDGTIVVRKDAARTEAHQENRNLLVSDDAVVHAKPHLEIDTDDVRCSHGATVGRLDPAQLFYLRSRGIDERVARATLMVAFARELILPISDIQVREFLESELSGLLPAGGDAALQVS